ncbi:MAG: helix-turn-helix transcriptional regulator [Bacteroidota bacterium]
MSSHKSLGNLEEVLLLLVAIMNKGEIYGFSIKLEYEKQMGKSLSMPAIHTVLKRLEQKGFLRSELGVATQKRGGKRKRLYQITKYGYRAISEIQENRTRLWGQVGEIGFE